MELLAERGGGGGVPRPGPAALVLDVAQALHTNSAPIAAVAATRSAGWSLAAIASLGLAELAAVATAALGPARARSAPQ